MGSKRVYGFIKSELDGTEKKYVAPASLKLPEEYSYEKFLPKILDQGTQSICVPCSISAFINWNINVDHNKPNSTDHNVKLMDIYRIRTNNGEGMTFKEALHYLYKNGVKTDFGVEKIDKYAMVGSIEALKYALVLNGPCVGGLPVYNSSKTKFWEQSYGFEGGHAISIVGYNKEGFVIRNSWGKYYGKNGYATIPYKDFNKFYEIWTIIA